VLHAEGTWAQVTILNANLWMELTKVLADWVCGKQEDTAEADFFSQWKNFSKLAQCLLLTDIISVSPAPGQELAQDPMPSTWKVFVSKCSRTCHLCHGEDAAKFLSIPRFLRCISLENTHWSIKAYKWHLLGHIEADPISLLSPCLLLSRDGPVA
jgi:hypothetical protein